MTEGLSIADAMALGRDNEAFGGNGAWWIIIFFLLFAMNGWGGNANAATEQLGITDAFNFNQLDNGIRDIQTSMGNYFCENRLGVANGIAEINSNIANLGFATQQGLCDISHNQDNLRYELEAKTNAIISANDKNTDRILAYLTQSEMDSLRTELQSAQFQLSQNAQTMNLVNQLMPVAKPAYITCSPYAAAFGMNTCGCA